jgi:hypothetical protein
MTALLDAAPGSAARERLGTAMRTLAAHGIASVGDVPAPVADAHLGIAAALRVRFPAGDGSYVFWTRGSDVATGLWLHCSGPSAADAAVAACMGAGLASVRYGERLVSVR